jgi:hypothetical protein
MKFTARLRIFLIGDKHQLTTVNGSRGSSVSIVSDYGLDDRATGGSIPGRGSQGVTLTTHPHVVLRSRMSRSYTFSPHKCHHGM